MNKSSISKNLIKESICEKKNYNETKFTILKSCTNISDLIKIETIYIYLNKPKLYKQR